MSVNAGTARIIGLSVGICIALLAAIRSPREKAITIPDPAADVALASSKGSQTMVIAGGCFWGVQAVFKHTKGVISSTSGYAGGSVKNPSYEAVSSGRTGQAE